MGYSAESNLVYGIFISDPEETVFWDSEENYFDLDYWWEKELGITESTSRLDAIKISESHPCPICVHKFGYFDDQGYIIHLKGHILSSSYVGGVTVTNDPDFFAHVFSLRPQLEKIREKYSLADREIGLFHTVSYG